MKNAIGYIQKDPNENKRNPNVIPFKYQLLAWIVLIAIYFVYKRFIAADSFGSTLDFIVIVAYNFGLFYFNIYVVLPRAFRGKAPAIYRVIGYLLLETILILTLLIGLSIATGALEFKLNGEELRFDILNLFSVLFLLFFGIILSLAYYGLLWGMHQFKRAEHKETLLEESEHALKVVELQYSKARLPTHFLSNTFMFLRMSLKHDPAKGVECINLLSDIVQFYELNAQDGLIPIEDELAQLNRYVAIHSIRYNKKVFLNIEKQGDLSAVKVIPMMILTLAENMYTYGILLEETKPAEIFISVKDDQLSICFMNWINEPDQMRQSSGFGLQSIQESLARFYPHFHSFRAERLGERYEVEIEISLPDRLVLHTAANSSSTKYQ